MAFVMKDRVRVATATTGTGAVALGAAVANAAKGYYRTFAVAGVANGDTVPYLIEDGANWETGIGTYASSGTVLTRTTVINNSAGTTSPISLSGSAEVAIVLTEQVMNGLLPTSGGTMTGDIILKGAPTADLHPATKKYVDDNAPSVDPKALAKAWVNFNGTGVVSIKSSYNVSSITDNGIGDYTVNFASPLPNANYVSAFSTLSYTNTNTANMVVTKSTDGVAGGRYA